MNAIPTVALRIIIGFVSIVIVTAMIVLAAPRSRRLMLLNILGIPSFFLLLNVGARILLEDGGISGGALIAVAMVIAVYLLIRSTTSKRKEENRCFSDQ